MKRLLVLLLVSTGLFFLTECGQRERNVSATEKAGHDKMDSASGQSVSLPEPYTTKSFVKYSKVIGWPEGKTPEVPAGFTITRFISGIKSPRNIYVAPNGDIFVALANTESKGAEKVKDAVTGRDDSQHTGKSLNQILLLRDQDRDGVAEVKAAFLKDLNQPFGMLVLDNSFYVANTDGLWKYPYTEGQTSISAEGKKVLELPAGGYNNHWTRNLIAATDGSKLYISVGSASNAGEHGMQEEIRRANIIEINPDGSGERIFASGLRNPIGMAWYPGSKTLWTVVNERDELGDDLVPDYLTSVKDGGFYGWPYAYFGQHKDPRINENDQKPELVQRTIVPDVALDSHSSSMGLAFCDHDALPKKYRGGAWVVQHGSWNRSDFSGYKVLFIPFRNGKPSGQPEDFITGFIADEERSEVYGRPVAIALTRDGDILLTDDASDTIWMIQVARK